ncbi:MAG: N-acetylmuramoyl-L-alanine amidase-like domain-containing protein [Bacteroidota bacterium]
MRLAPLTSCALLLALLGCHAQSAAPPQAPPAQAVAIAALTPSDPHFDTVMADARAQALHTQPIGEIVQAAGLAFLGTPYVAGLLDEPTEETLITRLDGFDCVLFVETALALARGIAVEDYAHASFVDRIREQRYRDGVLDGYCSRLHYFTEWIHDNEQRGLVQNVTAQIGGVPLEKELDFMSRNRDKYPRFATNDSLFAGIQSMEQRLANLEHHYIPQDQIREAYPALEAGDLVALVTNLDGLDVTHTGLVYAGPDGQRGLLHASTTGEVLVSPDLQAYVQNNRIQVGIIVARPVPPSL